MAGRTRAKGVTAFLAIAFGLAWGWEALVHLALGWSLVNPLVQMPAAFAPAIAALVVRRWITREGFGDSGCGRPGATTSWPGWPRSASPPSSWPSPPRRGAGGPAPGRSRS